LGTTNYLYNGLRSVEDVDGSGNILERYAQGVGVDEPLAELLSTTTNYYEQDGLGSATSLSSAAGVLTNTYSYDSFGKPAGSTGTVTNRFQYTGRELDSETGMYYYRARYFDPSAGRFLSEDPIQFIGGADFYSYVANNPMGFRDALGLCPTNPWDRRANVVKLLRAKNPCSDWFNKGQGSAPDIMSKVRILLGDPTPGPRSPDADTFPDSTSPITVYSDGRFFPDSKSGWPVGAIPDADGNPSGGYPPGSYGAQMIILLHELAHKVHLIPDDNKYDSPPGQSDKNTQTVMDYCAAAVTSSAP